MNARYVILLSSLGAFGSSCVSDPSHFETGTWTGVYSDSEGRAFDFTFSIEGTAADLRTSLFWPHAQGRPFPILNFEADSITVRMPDELVAFRCVVRWDDAGWHVGSCDDGGDATLWLSPPSSRSALPRGIVERTLSHPTIAWETREAAGLLTHISPDAMLSDSAQSAAAQMYDVLEEARALIQAPEDRENVHVFITASVEEMEAATGRAACGFVDIAVRAAFVVITDELACSHRHELMHLVSVRAWGWPRPPLDWLSEGVATWFDTRDSLARFRSCIGEVEAVAAHLAKKDSLIPMTEVIDNHRANNNKETGFRSTIQSPAFIGYLYDRWGLGAVETTWRGGTAGLARQTKMTLETILQEWRAHLLSTDDLQFAHNWTDILMNSCPG